MERLGRSERVNEGFGVVFLDLVVVGVVVGGEEVDEGEVVGLDEGVSV